MEPKENCYQAAIDWCLITFDVLGFVLNEQGINFHVVHDAVVVDNEHQETIVSHLAQLFQQP